ncbi:hypothetical protein A9Q81_06945 [Gammaproteobacteria bacterium 42_54_T18]|nr:hypothetical protein A9Q81_06945 [Gammaproteobacteria bacterium 42_54_T18]
MTNVVDALQARVSSPKLSEPGPTRSHVETLLRCAVRAPDHGRLKPWRFIVVEGEGRSALGELFEKALLAKDANASEQKRDKTKLMPLRAPMVIVAIANVTTSHKVPVMEQVIATGVAVQNMQLAAVELGYGAIWRTGDMATSSVVRNHFALEPEDQIVGFLYVGTPVGEARSPVAQDLGSCVEYWG